MAEKVKTVAVAVTGPKEDLLTVTKMRQTRRGKTKYVSESNKIPVGRPFRIHNSPTSPKIPVIRNYYLYTFPNVYVCQPPIYVNRTNTSTVPEKTPSIGRRMTGM